MQPDSHGKSIFLIEKLRTIKGFISSGAWFGASRNSREIYQWLYTDGSEVVFTNWKSGMGISANSINANKIYFYH